MGKGYTPQERKPKGSQFYELRAYKGVPQPGGPAEYHVPGRNPDGSVHARHEDRYRWAVGALAGAEDAMVGPGGRWLDCACGTGYGTQLLWELASADIAPAWVTGVDRSANAVAYAKQYHRPAGAPLTYQHLTIQSAGQWLRMLGPFDAVVCVETLEHLGKEVGAAWLQNVAANLPPYGALALCCPVGEGKASETNPWHLHEPTPDALRAQLLALFGRVHLSLEEYESTSGPAVQAKAICTQPKVPTP